MPQINIINTINSDHTNNPNQYNFYFYINQKWDDIPNEINKLYLSDFLIFQEEYTNTVIFNYQNGGFDGHDFLYYELFLGSDANHLINVTHQMYDTYRKQNSPTNISSMLNLFDRNLPNLAYTRWHQTFIDFLQISSNSAKLLRMEEIPFIHCPFYYPRPVDFITQQLISTSSEHLSFSKSGTSYKQLGITLNNFSQTCRYAWNTTTSSNPRDPCWITNQDPRYPHLSYDVRSYAATINVRQSITYKNDFYIWSTNDTLSGDIYFHLINDWLPINSPYYGLGDIAQTYDMTEDPGDGTYVLAQIHHSPYYIKSFNLKYGQSVQVTADEIKYKIPLGTYTSNIFNNQTTQYFVTSDIKLVFCDLDAFWTGYKNLFGDIGLYTSLYGLVKQTSCSFSGYPYIHSKSTQEYETSDGIYIYDYKKMTGSAGSVYLNNYTDGYGRYRILVVLAIIQRTSNSPSYYRYSNGTSTIWGYQVCPIGILVIRNLVYVLNENYSGVSNINPIPERCCKNTPVSQQYPVAIVNERGGLGAYNKSGGGITTYYNEDIGCPSYYYQLYNETCYKVESDYIQDLPDWLRLKVGQDGVHENWMQNKYSALHITSFNPFAYGYTYTNNGGGLWEVT